MSLVLSHGEYEILKQIFQDPILPYSQLADKVDFSAPTVKKKFKNLKDKDIIQGIYCEYHPDSVGLESHIFLLHVGSIDKLNLVEKILYLHPYTVMISDCYGPIMGVYLKVHVPIGTIDKFFLFLQHLKENDLIDEIVHSTTIGEGIKSYIDLTYWDPKKNEWKFRWDLWKKNLDSVDYIFHYDYFQKISKKKPKNVLDNIRYHDFLILKELTIDARQKNTDLSKKIDIPQYTFSRRLKFLNEYVIRNYSVDFNQRFFGLEDEIIFKAICSQRAMVKILYLKKNLLLPYQTDFRQTEDGFLWKMLLPPRDKIEVMNLLWSLFPQLQIILLDPKSYRKKTFNPENYSFRKMSWRDSKEFIVDQVLEKARKERYLA